NRLDDSIVTYIKRKFNLVIGRKTAKALKESIGAALPGRTDKMAVVGRDVVSGLPIEMEIAASVVSEGIRDDLDSIGSNIKMILEKVPPELAKDIVKSGVYLTGGGSLISDLAEYFSSLTNIGTNVAENGDEAVARGLNWVLSDEKYRRFGTTMKARLFN
ncbi:MAG: rod shape-determining protein, partial [Lachnospiraceae bacterium]|nr:rod shape-determining protein [Lachnospiraceae bacterium]